METRLSNFEVICKLGVGAYSSVYKVRRISDGQIYALKKVKLFDVGEREKQNALNEVRIIASIQHTNIISYKECFVDTSNAGTPELCIIMEFAEEGDLLVRIQNQIKSQMYIQEKEIWSILLQALHDRKIYHRDLKCANVFMFTDKRVKLGDFNVSKLAKKGLVYTQTGTPYYASPEVWQDKPYDHKADIWSLGCVIYEACTLKPPFRAKDMDGLYKAVMKGAFPPIPGIYTQELANVVKMMLQVKPETRPDCERLLQVPGLMKKTDVALMPKEDDTIQQLLKTIRWPQSKKGLQQHKSEVIHLNLQLPGANYNTAINNPNFNHIKRSGQSNVQSNRIKSQDMQQDTISQTNESIQNILVQIGKLQKPQEVSQNRSSVVEKPSPRKDMAYLESRQKTLLSCAVNEMLKVHNTHLNILELLSEPHNQSKNDSQRNNYGVHGGNNQSANYSQMSLNENSTELGLDEGVTHDQPRVKKISETLEARRVRISNSQHDRHEMLAKPQMPSASKDRIAKLQLDNGTDLAQNYYVRDVLSSLNKQQHSQKLPILYQNSSYSRQHSSNLQKNVIEEEYQLDHNKPTLGLRKNSNSVTSEKKPLVRVIKKLHPKPYLGDKSNQDRSNISLNKDSISYQASSAERLKKQYIDLEPLPKLPVHRSKH